MAKITNIELENVRCFAGRQSARTGRVTLLVGENGSGKSTFLGCYKTIAKLAALHDLAEDNHFDDAPFRMGGFASIARRDATAFTVGARFADHCHESIAFTFRPDRNGNLPIDQEMKLRYRGNNGALHNLHFTAPEAADILLHVQASGFAFDLLQGEFSFRSVSTWLSRYVRHGYLPFGGELGLFRSRTHNQDLFAREAGFLRFTSLLSRELPFPDPASLPVDTPGAELSPRQREYPSTPAHLLSDDDGFFTFLDEMGEVLGLWRTVSVEPAPGGRGVQVLVDTPHGQFNLLDVGYGVHSLLQVLGALYNAAPDAVLLLQQPEVHVHPKAQAALAEWMAMSGRSFVIETHSDHVVDRFRICVMKGLLDPDALSIVYFEPSTDGSSSTIHSISVDPQGNLHGEPNGYRQFFLQETKFLLGFK